MRAAQSGSVGRAASFSPRSKGCIPLTSFWPLTAPAGTRPRCGPWPNGRARRPDAPAGVLSSGVPAPWAGHRATFLTRSLWHSFAPSDQPDQPLRRFPGDPVRACRDGVAEEDDRAEDRPLDDAHVSCPVRCLPACLGQSVKASATLAPPGQFVPCHQFSAVRSRTLNAAATCVGLAKFSCKNFAKRSLKNLSNDMDPAPERCCALFMGTDAEEPDMRGDDPPDGRLRTAAVMRPSPTCP